jgi:hypothetical protein
MSDWRILEEDLMGFVTVAFLGASKISYSMRNRMGIGSKDVVASTAYIIFYYV